ncbi:MAG: hypothetical protein ACREBE_07825, partial [bacterium]
SLAAEAIVRTVATAPPPRARVGVLALAHLDVANRGGAGLFGITIDLTRHLQAQVAAVVGPSSGGYAGATVALLGGRLRPIVSAGMPVFASSGARFAVRAAGGLELDVNRHLALIAELGIEHVFKPEDDVERQRLLVIPAIGAAGRL